MGIKKDLGLKKFRNPYKKAMVNILYTHSWVLDKIKGFTNSEKLTPQQHNMLQILRGNSTPTSTLQLRERMLGKMSDTSRIVNRLIAKKLVKKRNSKKDKRLVEISILPQGLNVLRKLDSRNEELDSILYGLTKKEADLLSNLLDKLHNHQ